MNWTLLVALVAVFLLFYFTYLRLRPRRMKFIPLPGYSPLPEDKRKDIKRRWAYVQKNYARVNDDRAANKECPLCRRTDTHRYRHIYTYKKFSWTELDYDHIMDVHTRWDDTSTYFQPEPDFVQMLEEATANISEGGLNHALGPDYSM